MVEGEPQFEEPIIAEVVLDESQFGKGNPPGEAGETRNGFSFYRERKDKTSRTYWEKLTARMGDIPTLVAVTEQQFKRWKKDKLIAVPAVWHNIEGRLWEVKTQKPAWLNEALDEENE